MNPEPVDELTRALTDAIWRSCAGRPSDAVMEALARTTALVVSVCCDSQLDAKSVLVEQFFKTKYLTLDNWDEFEDNRSQRRSNSG